MLLKLDPEAITFSEMRELGRLLTRMKNPTDLQGPPNYLLLKKERAADIEPTPISGQKAEVVEQELAKRGFTISEEEPSQHILQKKTSIEGSSAVEPIATVTIDARTKQELVDAYNAAKNAKKVFKAFDFNNRSSAKNQAKTAFKKAEAAFEALCIKEGITLEVVNQWSSEASV